MSKAKLGKMRKRPQQNMRLGLIGCYLKHKYFDESRTPIHFIIYGFFWGPRDALGQGALRHVVQPSISAIGYSNFNPNNPNNEWHRSVRARIKFELDWPHYTM